MSNQTIKIIITGALLLQGLSHGRAFLALLTDASRSGGQPPVPVRSWLLPSLSLRNSAIIASLFWLLATMGFIAAALIFWGIFFSGEIWRQLAIASSVVSSLGIVIFSRIWPGAPNRKLANIDTVIAMVINAATLSCCSGLGGRRSRSSATESPGLTSFLLPFIPFSGANAVHGPVPARSVRGWFEQLRNFQPCRRHGKP